MLRARLDPITTASDWVDTVRLRDSDDGTDFVLTDCDAELAVRKIGCQTVTTVASTTDGKITFPATGYVHWEVLADSYSWDVGEYEVKLTLSRDAYTEIFILGTLPVLDGMNQ
jgi:hypothetical protein